jgi:hypothetical protein
MVRVDAAALDLMLTGFLDVDVDTVTNQVTWDQHQSGGN